MPAPGILTRPAHSVIISLNGTHRYASCSTVVVAAGDCSSEPFNNIPDRLLIVRLPPTQSHVLAGCINIHIDNQSIVIATTGARSERRTSKTKDSVEGFGITN